MKLVLFVVLAIAIFTTDSRDPPDKPDKVDDPVHNSMEERKGENEIELRVWDLISRLTFHSEKVSWTTAYFRCKSYKARLVVLDNPRAFHIYMYYNHRGQRFWLGASDRYHEGVWTWVNGQPLSRFPWPYPQPDNQGGNQDCLHWGWNNKYDDAYCTYTIGYVCEHGYN